MAAPPSAFDPTDLGPPLPLDFYARPADKVAPELLGKVLAVRCNAQVRAGRITEVEAYLGVSDLACHASKGFTKRTSTLYGAPGCAYVYLIYGQHDLFNVVCERVGEPHAVLLRALELLPSPPASGAHEGEIPVAQSGSRPPRGDGPGRLTRALGINLSHNGTMLNEPPITIHHGPAPTNVVVTARVGVTYADEWADAPLRYYDAASSSVSKPAPSTIGRG